MLGLADVGIEIDTAACLTRRAAGHTTIQADVSTWPMEQMAGKVTGLIASPPCGDWSMAGRKKGREGETGGLVDIMPGIIDVLRPEWIAFEQVPLVLPIWKYQASLYRDMGYSTWTGIINCANLGLPQTRKRAFLMASRVKTAIPPESTHAKDPQPSIFGELKPWVSMAEALGWGFDGQTVGFARKDDLGTSETGYRERDMRSVDQPAFVVTAKARSWVLNPGKTDTQPNRRHYEPSEPAPTIAFGHDAANWQWEDTEAVQESFRWLDRRQDYVDGEGTVPMIPQSEPAPTLTGKALEGVAVWRERLHNQTGNDNGDWVTERPATTIASRGLVPHPGENSNRFNESDKSRNDGISISMHEALILQGFRPDYPVQGTRTAGFRQIGDAVPPPVAAAILSSLTGRPIL